MPHRLSGGSASVDISVVMPCLNEGGSVQACVLKAFEGIGRTGLAGEVIVCDNGSTDGSAVVAAAAGARVVHEEQRGYGNAYRRGFAAATGSVIVMGDADESYDFTQIPELIAPLAVGYDYVVGSRFGGRIEKGAMTFSHRYIGNPLLTAVHNRFFGLRSSDAHSGMRAFTRDAYERMALRTEGMEFASELGVRAARAGLRVAEVPIVYRRRVGVTKLRTFRDGWRHLRFMLLMCPQWLYVIPGAALFVIGLVGQIALLLTRLSVGGHQLDVHFSVLFALVTILGGQALTFGVFARTYSAALGFEPEGRLQSRVRRDFTLERGIGLGLGLFIIGFSVDAWVLVTWLGSGLATLDAMRPALLAMTFMVLGVQVIFGSFFLALLGFVGVTTGSASSNGDSGMVLDMFGRRRRSRAVPTGARDAAPTTIYTRQ
jgi:glycosyltransferase involved in cell wall biosynthesis